MAGPHAGQAAPALHEFVVLGRTQFGASPPCTHALAWLGASVMVVAPQPGLRLTALDLVRTRGTPTIELDLRREPGRAGTSRPGRRTVGG
jgi:crotonobetainyl-CoA:carnitine CoA-transferase CaiB-like acyl-CoA transferase